MFTGFQEAQGEVDGASVLVRHAGVGPAVALLHGHPRTSATWHRVAPQLVEHGFSVVCPDLRGYGRPRRPEPTADHTGYSMRAAAGGEGQRVSDRRGRVRSRGDGRPRGATQTTGADLR